MRLGKPLYNSNSSRVTGSHGVSGNSINRKPNQRVRIGWKDFALAFFMLTTFYSSFLTTIAPNQHYHQQPSQQQYSPQTSTPEMRGKDNNAVPAPITSLTSSSLKSSTLPLINNDNSTVMDETQGWVNIQVFAGKNSILYQRARSKWYSQVGQDKIIAAITRQMKDGYYIDLAAHDAVHFSNTLALEKYFGWTGLCIEANPEYWRDLSFRNCRVIGAAVGQTRMAKVKFSLNKEFGGIVGKDFDNKVDQAHPFRKTDGELEFYTVPLLEILQRNHVPNVIDYMSLDVEGAELFIMKDFPFEEYTIRLMTIERPKESLRSLLSANGYKLLRIISKFGETLWVHSSMEALIDEDAIRTFKFPKQDITETIPE